MKVKKEYRRAEITQLIELLRPVYDCVRLISPAECREFRINEQGGMEDVRSCYDVWQRTSRCTNCSSYQALLTGARKSKTEFFEGSVYHIRSVPIRILLNETESKDCVLELVSCSSIDEEFGEGMRVSGSSAYYIAVRDPLTQIYNREGFYLYTQRKLLEEPDVRRLMIAIDIRHFKLINELFGREKGDEVLVMVADYMRRNCDDCDVYGRIGGDHFALCIPEANYSEERFLKGLEELRGLFKSREFRLHIHIGIFPVPKTEMSVPQMYDRAHMAIRQIHNSGEHMAAWFNPKLMSVTLREQQVISEFEQKDGLRGFGIVLQPIVDGNGTAAGAEALVRWNRAEGDLTEPENLVAILEKFDLIARLDRHIWELSAKQLKAWQGTAFAGLFLSVNISPRDFIYMDVYQVLEDLVETYGIDRKKLHLEITETALMSDPEGQFARVRKLREAGFFVAVDDFGKGYSSLSLIKDLEADALKMDMSFLRGRTRPDRFRTIVSAVIRMTKELGMTVVAEGIEREEQAGYFREQNCDLYQGYYFAKPMEVCSFEEWVREAL